MLTFLSFSGKKMVHAAILVVLIITAQLCIASTDECNSKATPKFPAILVFGDSTVDTGNNNYIFTAFKGNHQPYGQNFPGRVPTGRFSNGKLVPDFMASILGIKEAVPPFLDPSLSDKDVLTGVSFASAGSGFDDLTTMVSGVIPVSRQPEYFKNYIQRLEGIAGFRKATRRIQFNIHQYQNFLHSILQNLVKKLYDLGCRKMVVSGIPPIGCLPIQMTAEFWMKRSCNREQNEDAQSYNDKLEKLLPQIEAELPGSTIQYADIYNPLMDMINNPQKYDFAETKRGCCGTGLLEAGPLCSRLEAVCANPSHYLFWDSIHPTESAYKFISETLESLIPKTSHIDNMC